MSCKETIIENSERSYENVFMPTLRVSAQYCAINKYLFSIDDKLMTC